MNRFKKMLCLATLCISGVVSVFPLYAQDDGSESNRLEEIIVTATKRAASLEEIPIAISTISADDIQIRNIQRFEDYLTSVPGVQFTPSGDIFGQSISIRGVVDPSSAGSTQSPVALYLDDTPLTLNQGALNLDYSTFGVEQIIFIKGPHSTLYGASSLGGTIKIVTRKPSVDQTIIRGGATLSAIEEGDTGYSAYASISGPVIDDRLAMEVTAYSKRRAGFVDDIDRNLSDINAVDTYGGRLAARFHATDRLTVDGTIYFQKMEAENPDQHGPDQFGDLNTGALLFDQKQTDEFTLGTLVVNYAFDSAEFVSATSIYDREPWYLQDASSSFFNFGIPGSEVPYLIYAPTDVISQEFRLVSKSDSKLTWLFGALYYNEEYIETFDVEHSVVGPLFVGPLAYEYTTKAVFGEAGYEIAEGLVLTAGLRYSDYTSKTDFSPTGLFALPPEQNRFSETDTSPRFAINYEIDRGSVYAQAAKGFRLGAANVPLPTGPTDNVPPFFDSDSLWNYEIGAKTSWFDRRLLANLAFYYIDWKNIQVNQFNSLGLVFIDNEGNAEIRGAELETTALLTPSTQWTVGVAYNDGELSDEIPNVAPAGSKIPNVPEWTFSTGLQQDFQLVQRDAFGRLDYVYVDSFLNSILGAEGALVENGDYHKLDVRFGMNIGSFDVQLFATNLLDERPYIRVSNFGRQAVSTLQPRTYGVGVTFEF